MDLKSFDMSMLKKLSDPKLAGDLNAYLEKIPERAGHTILIAAGIAWAIAAAAGLFTTMQVQQLTELRNAANEAKALVPVVPTISDNPVPEAEVKAFTEKSTKVYPNLKFDSNGSNIIITSNSTAHYAEFREAIGHVQNGGQGWRIGLQKLCVGRECDTQYQLAISLSVSKVSVDGTPPAGG